MAHRLSDDELRESLKDYGEDVGPITPTTRSTWERRLSALRKTKNYAHRKSALNAFSSDDSEIENSSTNAHRRKRTSRHSSGDKLNLSSSLDGDIFKKPSPSFVTRGKRAVHHKDQSVVGKVKKKSAYDVETSDSDFDTDFSFSLSKSPRRTRRKNASPVRTEGTPELEKRFSFDSERNRQKPLGSSWNSNNESYFQHSSPSLEQLKRDAADHANGYISNNLSNGQLSEDREEGSSTNYSHCISWLLLLGTVAFFVVIGVVYVAELQKTTQVASKTHPKLCDEIKEEDCKYVIFVSRELHHLLTTIAGVYDCASDKELKRRNLTLSEARDGLSDFFRSDEVLKDSFPMEQFDYLFNESVALLKRNPDMGIRFHPEGGLDVSALEAAQGSKSFWCRIRLSLQWTFAKILFLGFVGSLTFVCFLFAKLWKKRREAQEKVFYEMVEKVIDILRETPDWSSESEPCKVVVNVRDAIIPAKERKTKLWLWDRVVAFIEENESRVSVECRTINGEDFKVWRWQPCTTTENEGTKQGKVWQGQAFSNIGRGKNITYSLSACLKIRNMFDTEVEYEKGWQVSIQDAILEKCEGNDGIRHIAIDTSSNEGCVYMLCDSTDAAGKAFNDLHGWWFDGKLVTVKYIPYKRYLERFPESEHCTEPLRPSNNKRLSLSTPFFSSVLERS